MPEETNVELGNDAVETPTEQVDAGTTTNTGKDAVEVETSSLAAQLEEFKRANRAISGERSEAKKEARAERERAERLEAQLAEMNQKLDQFGKGKQEEAGDYQDAGKLHPNLKGRNYDPADDTIEIKGQWYPAELVVGNEQFKEFQAKQAEAAQTQEQAAEQQRLEQGWSKLASGVSSDIDTLLTKLNPDLDPNKKTFATRTLQNEVEAKLAKAGIVITDPYNPPDGFLEATKTAISEAYSEFREMFGAAWAKQTEANENLRQTHPVKPDGQPGVPNSKPYWAMTDAEKDAAAQSAFQTGVVARRGKG